MASENKQTIFGRVISAKRNKTVTVLVEWAKRHPTYGKVMKRNTKYQVHDAENSSREGDLVEIVQVRPISKTKSWALVKVVEQANKVEG